MTNPTPAPPGDRLMRIGGIVTLVGLGFTVIAMLPLIFDSLDLPPAMWFLSMITGVGLAIILLGVFRSARSRRRR